MFYGAKRVGGTANETEVGAVTLVTRLPNGQQSDHIVLNGYESPIIIQPDAISWFPEETTATYVDCLAFRENSYVGGKSFEIYATQSLGGAFVLVATTTASTADGTGFCTLAVVQDAGQLFQHITTEQQNTLNSNYDVEQLAVIALLTYEQQLIFVSGTTSQKNAIIDTLTPEQQAPFVSLPIAFIQTIEEKSADKLTMEQIIFKLKSGQYISDDDSVFYALGNSKMATAAMAEIDAGRGYDGLRNIGLTQSQALKVLSIYNVTLEIAKYESEQALAVLEADPTKIQSLQTYLTSLIPPLTLPTLSTYLGQIRSNHAIYSAIRNWTP